MSKHFSYPILIVPLSVMFLVRTATATDLDNSESEACRLVRSAIARINGRDADLKQIEQDLTEARRLHAPHIQRDNSGRYFASYDIENLIVRGLALVLIKENRGDEAIRLLHKDGHRILQSQSVAHDLAHELIRKREYKQAWKILTDWRTRHPPPVGTPQYLQYHHWQRMTDWCWEQMHLPPGQQKDPPLNITGEQDT